MKTKPFDLERALAGDEVVTRRGDEVIKIVNFNEYFDKSDLCVFYFYKLGGIVKEGQWVREDGPAAVGRDWDFELLMLDEEPLKIEVGKFYKTRDGHKAYVYKKVRSGSDYPFRWVCTEKNSSNYDYYTCTEHGVYNCSGIFTENDLIEEWKD